MSKLCISVELHNGNNPARLLSALERFEDPCHALDTLWFVCTPWTAEQVYAYLRRYLDPIRYAFFRTFEDKVRFLSHI